MLSKQTATSIRIPDHQILRKIGGGSYGEVWLAQTVTGRLRAIKLVSRHNFFDEASFEREFEGIRKFEPISRDHPGFVNILHVGRANHEGEMCYYCIMELGDDRLSGSDINAIEYEPRTLRGDLLAANHQPLPLDMCLNVGIHLAEALHFLHQAGLVHRDVKPANIIFVKGKAKLADIGLVAARDQRTFVGTEGFVPPEGPGSVEADIYSLGKILYEMVTGKDRLDFPELPEESPDPKYHALWLGLNRVICETCDPEKSRRLWTTGDSLAQALRHLQSGRKPKKRIPGWRNFWVTSSALFSILLTSIIWYIWGHNIKRPENTKNSATEFPVVEKSPVKTSASDPVYGHVRIISYPEGAAVSNKQGKHLGFTPLTLEEKLNTETTYTLNLKGYRPREINAKILPSAAQTPILVGGDLEVFAPPVEGQTWQDPFGNAYTAESNFHFSKNLVTSELWQHFQDDSEAKIENFQIVTYDGTNTVVETTLENAEKFCDWLYRRCMQEGYMSANLEIEPKIEVSPSIKNEQLHPFRALIRPITYGTIEIATNPKDAEIYLNGVFQGDTKHSPLTINRVRPGTYTIDVIKDGYQLVHMRREMKKSMAQSFSVPLFPNQSAMFGKAWINSLSMHFLPIGENLLASIWGTRVSDYNAFLEANPKYPRPRKPSFLQGGNHPVIFVSRLDAEAFCKWLTIKEQKEGKISQTQQYRIPTDLEWSEMAGLEDNPDVPPAKRDTMKTSIFEWGNAWPPPNYFGNYADFTALKSGLLSKDRTIPNYNDGYAGTSPVGSYAPNPLGFYDLSGNVQEWVADDYDTKKSGPNFGVLRGGGWNSFQKENLYVGYRNPVMPNRNDSMYGFRIVLSRKNPADKKAP